MSCNEKMNESIREKLKDNKIFPWLSGYCLDDFEWSHWDGAIACLSAPVAEAEGAKIQKCCTPAELRYINENLSEEAWNKLGLKLVEEKIVFPVPYTVVQLTKEKREALERIAERLEDNKTCGASCNACRGIICNTTCYTCNRRQRAAAFRLVFEAQKPILEYEIPQLDEKERGQLESIIQKIESGAASCGSEICRTGNVCSKIFMTARETFRRCYFCDACPDKQQALAALKYVLKQQKPLLPPHNLFQLEQGKHAALKEASENKSITDVIACLDGCNGWACSDCYAIFPEVSFGTPCPCSQHGKDPVNEIVDKILALGPKPEPKKPFVQHAAVRTATAPHPTGGPGTIMKINSQDENGLLCDGEWYHDLKNIQRITNPSEACKILMELEGKPDIVKAIKEWLLRNSDALENQHDQYDTGYWYACDNLLSFIENLESKAGKEK